MVTKEKRIQRMKKREERKERIRIEGENGE